MRLGSVLLATALSIALGCTHATREQNADASDTPFVPERLRVMALPGGNGVLTVTALTLRRGPRSPELYAALENTGATPACHAAFAVELYDMHDQSVAAGITGLLSQRFYRLTDGSSAIAACVAPGDVTLAAITDLPADLVLEDVGTVIYHCTYFALDVAPIDGLRVNGLRSVRASSGTAYRGKLINGFDVAVSAPSVAVFALTSGGRPFGVASAAADVDLPPGGEWSFETDPIAAQGSAEAAYPAAALAK